MQEIIIFLLGVILILCLVGIILLVSVILSFVVLNMLRDIGTSYKAAIRKNNMAYNETPIPPNKE